MFGGNRVKNHVNHGLGWTKVSTVPGKITGETLLRYPKKKKW
jgi:hypothetical protein